MRVALVHDWLVGQRGGEQVLLSLCRMYPGATIFTLVHRPKAVAATIESHPIVTSFIQKLVGPSGRFRHLLPLFPKAIEALDVSGFDLVISTSHCVAHGVRARKDAVHIAYVHTPMRYLYDQMAHYLPAQLPWGLQPVGLTCARALTTPLRTWDRRAAQRPTALVANSHFVAARIARVWHREASVVHPPVSLGSSAVAPDFSAPARGSQPLRQGLLWVGALVPYKRVEICVAVSNALGVPLTIVGRGPQLATLKAAAGPQVTFLEGLDEPQLHQLYRSHEALMYPGEEDFGIVPVEAMAHGCPVLGLGRGGVCESVVAHGPRATGVLTQDGSVEAFAHSFLQLRRQVGQGLLQAQTLSTQAQKFSHKAFARKLHAVVHKHIMSGNLS